MRALAALAAVIACGCGRIGFAALDDATNGSGSTDADALPAGPCTPITTVIPGYAPRGYKITRVPNGWAIVGSQDGTTGDVRLVTIDDANTIAPPITLIAGTGISSVDWVNDALVIVYSTTAPHAARFALDGTLLGGVVDITATNAFQTDRAGTAIEVGLMGPSAGTASIATLDASGPLALGPPHQVTASAFGIAAVSRGPNGVAVAWESGTAGNLQMHLSGLDATGALRLTDRPYGPSSGATDIIWTGTHHVFTWVPTAGQPPSMVLLDENLAELTPVTNFLGLASGSSYLEWNGRELGTGRIDFIAAAHDVAFAPATENGDRLAADTYFGTGSFGSVTNPFLASGPSRFAFTWAAGTNLRQYFVVVCR